MPLANTPKPQFPNVPQVPGAPHVARPPVGNVQNTIVSTVSDIARIARLFFPPQWGLYTVGGAPVLTASAGLSATGLSNLPGAVNRLVSANGLSSLFSGDAASVHGVEFRSDKRISSAPQEEGAFLSYNKVSDPFQSRVTYLQGGSDDDRSSFLAQCKQALDTLELFMLVMPDFTYPSVNVVGYSYQRTSRRGMTLLQVEVQVEQVRVVGTAQFTNTATASGQSPTNGATVQPTTPPAGTPANVAGGVQ